VFTRELQNRVDFNFRNGSIPPYPKGGSSGMYLGATSDMTPGLIEHIMVLTGNQIKLFFALVAATDEWNQVHKTRKEIGAVYMKSYQASNISADIAKLIKLEMIAMIGSVVMVSPYLVVPGVKNPKLKSTIQTVWEELVWFIEPTEG